ncbi:unnamed protein product [Rotaria magnacalcarata]|uniref:Uncharacterized protein n=1 Tax=Rotaria magnacalcarata TaxID=392030 RepID=A0A8S2JZ95_9BILA|nr:unnamed protein product [Rotaria magnacalcarata]CAF4104474.1 unnamed protein product [Rotaria magnacalcarata]CAF4833871.1 unnamed protein product [Rotaria magnacalcarata]
MPVAIHFPLNPLEGRRLQNHEFDSQQMANFSQRLTNVENNLQRVTTDLQGLKDNVLSCLFNSFPIYYLMLIESFQSVSASDRN